MSSQKTSLYPQKSPVYPQKEPCISSKEPYRSAKEGNQKRAIETLSARTRYPPRELSYKQLTRGVLLSKEDIYREVYTLLSRELSTLL